MFSDLALKEQDGEEKLKMLKYLIGSDGPEIYNTLWWETDEKDRTLETVLDTFTGCCQPKQNETVERFKFNIRKQEDETFEKYITDVKALAKSCNFGTLADSLVRDKLVCGIKD